MDIEILSDIVRLLGESGLFAGLAEPMLLGLARRMRRVTFPAGRLIFSRGDPGGDLYVVANGRVRLSICTSDGRELSFAQAEPGTVFGEISALDGAVRTSNATAVNAVEVFALSRRDLADQTRENPEIAQAAIAFVCARLRSTNQTLESIALHSIEVRLARFILFALERAGPRADPGGLLRLNMSQSDLALLIGASRPKVNAALAHLEEAGAIKRAGDAFRCDRAALSRLADIGA
ncbi:Crp/Fnr family transcriptional regulator [Methylobacterium sp. sgz302541]|uniref:Crp/Fnr family transcriptional regulator n=1 Tax=unclassified Methylobacterium TaxID=2615210 RepID=UPI003D32DCF8